MANHHVIRAILAGSLTLAIAGCQSMANSIVTPGGTSMQGMNAGRPSTTSPLVPLTPSTDFSPDSEYANPDIGARGAFGPGYGAIKGSFVSPYVLPAPVATPDATSGPEAVPRNEMVPYRDTFFKNYKVNPFIETELDSFSTFALDVDTGSYSFARGQLASGKLPPKDSVRTEEYLNAFGYLYPQPASGKFAIHTELGPSYFGSADAKLLRIGIQGKEVLDRKRKDAVLTYVIDVSGSMNQNNRLELVKQSLSYLVGQLRPTDKVGIVIYGTVARVALPHTLVADKTRILAAIQGLRPEGSTNVEAGLTLGYDEAGKAFSNGAINRVILCSDGVANVGETGPDRIISTIKARSESGITLTTLGFGLGDYNDALMEQLANQGDGSYAYIDTLDESRRLFGADLTSTLQVIAKDAKLQVAFNPAVVAQYRLLGYENRDVADKDFRNDSIDAGEIGSNHSVTALYELQLKPDVTAGEVATVFMRYKDVDDYQRVQEINRKVEIAELKSFRNTSPSFQLATAVAEFAEQLRGAVFASDGKLSEVQGLADQLQGQLPDTRLRDFKLQVDSALRIQQPLAIRSTSDLVAGSQNPDKLPAWEQYLLRQLGGGSNQANE